jgi:hypothetical protein
MRMGDRAVSSRRRTETLTVPRAALFRTISSISD